MGTEFPIVIGAKKESHLNDFTQVCSDCFVRMKCTENRIISLSSDWGNHSWVYDAYTHIVKKPCVNFKNFMSYKHIMLNPQPNGSYIVNAIKLDDDWHGLFEVEKKWG